jgi:hypothetical protein
MDFKAWGKLKKKYKRKNAFRDFELYFEEKYMEKLIENKSSLLYSEKITAKRLGIGYSTLKLLRRAKKISHVRVGRRVFYRLTDIENFISKSAVAI